MFQVQVPVRAGVKLLSFSLALAFGLAASGAVQAQQPEGCECVTPAQGAGEGQPVGTVTSASGRVNVLGQQGWAPGSAGTPILSGGKVETGLVSNASIQVGRCQLEVGQQTQVTVTPADGQLCVARAQTNPINLTQAALLAGGAAGAALIISSVDTSTGINFPVSP